MKTLENCSTCYQTQHPIAPILKTVILYSGIQNKLVKTQCSVYKRL